MRPQIQNRPHLGHVEYEAVEYDPLGVILERLAGLEAEIAEERAALEKMLGE